MSDIKGRELLIKKYEAARKHTRNKGLICFVFGSVSAIFITWEWKSSVLNWFILIAAAIIALYGFLNMSKARKLPVFEKSPVGLFISGASENSLEALLIRRSGEELEGTNKYKAVISFIDATGDGVNIVAKSYPEYRAVSGYLKAKLKGKCTIMDITFDEYRENKKMYEESEAAGKALAGEPGTPKIY